MGEMVTEAEHRRVKATIERAMKFARLDLEDSALLASVLSILLQARELLDGKGSSS